MRNADPRVRDAGNLLLATAIASRAIPQSVSEDLLHLVHDLIEIEVAQDQRGRAAVAYYNFGQQLAALGRYELALAAYTAAADYDPRYLDHDYYNCELGRVYHLLRDYGGAASAYRKALQNGGDAPQLVPLLADSLLLSGRYRDTIELLAGWDSTDSHSASLAAVVGVVADLVVRTTGLERQVRREPVPNEDVLRSDPRDRLQYLIDVDALDPRYWLGAADVLPDEDDLPWAMLLAHMSGDPRFWATATVTAHRLGNPLVSELAEQAYRRCGADYLNVLSHLSDSDDDGEPWFDLSKDEISALVNEMCGRLAVLPDHRQ